jgi:hypothetical protein
MTERTTFEHRLTAGLNDLAGPVRGVDARTIAVRAAAAAAPRTGLLRWLPLTPGDRSTSVSMRLVLTAVTLLLLAGLAIVAGMLPRVERTVTACVGVADLDHARPWPDGGSGVAWAVGALPVGGGTAAGSIVAIQSAGAEVGSIVLIDTRNGDVCRLVATHIDVASPGRAPESGAPIRLATSPTGTALAIALKDRVLVWSELGLVDVWSSDADREPNAVWSPDGSILGVWVAGEGTGNFHLLSFDGTPRAPLVLSGRIGSAAWAPDGSRVAFSRSQATSESQIVIGELEGGSVTVLAEGDEHPWRSVHAWRDDDVLVLDRASPTLITRAQIMPVDQPLNLVDGAPPLPSASFGNPWISPDGRWYALLDQFTNLLVVDVPTAMQRMDISRGVGATGAFDVVSWAPGSQMLAFTKAESESGPPTGVWVVNVDGSGLRQVAGGDISLVDRAWLP